MTPVLLDASCVLAWLHDEPGWREVDDHITSAYITSVNMVEVITRVEREGRDGMLVATGLVQSGLTVVPVGWPEISASARVRQASGVSSRRELSRGCRLPLLRMGSGHGRLDGRSGLGRTRPAGARHGHPMTARPRRCGAITDPLAQFR